MGAFAAKFLKAPEWEFDKSEADDIGRATADVLSLYTDVKLPAEVIAWGNLAMVMAMALGPRLYLTQERLKKERMRDVTPGPQNSGNVVPIRPGPEVFVDPTLSTAPPPIPDAPPHSPAQPPTGVELNRSLFPDEFKF